MKFKNRIRLPPLEHYFYNFLNFWTKNYYFLLDYFDGNYNYSIDYYLQLGWPEGADLGPRPPLRFPHPDNIKIKIKITYKNSVKE